MTDRDRERHEAASLLRQGDEQRRAGDHGAALDTYREAGRRLDQARQGELSAHAWRRAGHCAQQLGRLEEAGECLHEAVATARRLRLESVLSDALGDLGILATHSGRPLEAAAFHHEGLEAARGVQDVRGVATHTGNLGLLALARGDHEEARRTLREALTAYTALEDSLGAATARNALGELERAEGDEEAARDAFREARALWRSAGAPAGEALALSNLGNLERVVGRLDEARGHFEEALALAGRAGDRRGEARSLTNLGNVALARGDREEARRCYGRSAELHREIGFVAGMATDQVNLANLALEEGRFDVAREAWRQAGEAFVASRNARAALDVACLGAQLDARMGRLEEAEEVFREAARQAEALSYDEALGRIHVNLAAVAFARGEVDRALEGFLGGAGWFREHERPAEELACLVAAADAHLAAGDPGAAREVARRAVEVAGDEAGGAAAAEARAAVARVDYEQQPAAARREALLHAADRLEEAGGLLEALGHRATVAERDAAGGDPTLAREVMERARGLGSRPAGLDAESVLLAWGDAPDTDRLRALGEEAESLGFGLLALRIGRRLAEALERAGEAEEGAALRAALLDRARESGAGAEAGRLAGGDASG